MHVVIFATKVRIYVEILATKVCICCGFRNTLHFLNSRQTVMEWNGLAGTGVATAQKIVQRPTPFLTRHFASRLGGVPPMNNLPHDHVRIDEYTQTGATLKKKTKQEIQWRSPRVPAQ